MSEIEDVAVTGEFRNDTQCRGFNFVVRCEKNCGVEIPLNGDLWSGKFANFAEWNAPVDAKDVGSNLNDFQK